MAELGKFSVFEQLDLSRITGGKVVAARGPALDSPRDLAVQAVYVVPAPLAKTVELHRRWDATRHQELKVRLHGDISGKPTPGDFGKLTSASNNSALKALVSATQKLPDKTGLQLSSEEAKAYSNDGGGNSSGALPPAVSAFWTRALSQRVQAFSSRGLAGQPAYDLGGQSIRVSEELSRLLKEQPKLRTQFRGLIDQTPLSGGTGGLSASHYWELFDVEGQGALSLGASYAREGGDSAQLLDLQYYSSGGYLALFTLYQMWPITVDNRPATLVWRGDSLSSVALSGLKGVERMGSGAAMMKELQKTITLFLKDAGK